MSKMICAGITAVLALAMPALPLAAQTGEAAPAAVSPAPATVTVDFAKLRGTNPRPERFNNLSRAARWTEQRDADVAFFNQQGLHGNTYRVWIDAERIYDPATGAYDYTGIEDYLADVSRLSDNLLIVMDTRISVRDFRKTPEQIKPIIKTIMSHLKARFPQIRYVEAFNEPDHNLAKVVTPSSLYDYYIAYYQAVNEINRELRPKVPLQVGGPAFMQYNEVWMRAFLDRYKADPAPDKRLDFISYHAYGRFPEGTGDTAGPRAFHFYKIDPSEVVSDRPKLEQELASRGLDTRIPSFITELGIYPGPSFDNAKDARPDYLIGAAGVPSLLYWFLEHPGNVPFNWVLRHSTEERKDQLITRAGEDRKTPMTNTFTPYGNAMAMMARLKDKRVSASSDALQAGQGVFAIATKDRTGAAVMVWNYQHTGARSYQVSIDMSGLPGKLRGKRVRQRAYRIDDKLSNYWADPAKANLQQVSDTIVRTGASHKVTVDLSPNALQLIVLEPAK